MIKIIIFLLCATVLVTLLNHYQKTFTVPVLVCCGCVVFFYTFELLQDTVYQINKLSETIGLNTSYMRLLLKVLGIAYICEFASAVCTDCGQTSFAAKIDLVGKLLILSQSVPVFAELIKIIRTILPV